MATILDEIADYKRAFVADCIAQVSLEEMIDRADRAPRPRSLFERLASSDDVAVLAEIKKASPSKGLIRADFDPVAIGQTYEANGASGISVLTDEKYFQGANQFLADVHHQVDLPLLRKEFTVDPYQIYEAKAIGASAVLLIVTMLTEAELTDFLGVARSIDLDVLVEVHTEDEAKSAADAGADMIGINNRDLKTFTTDIATTERVIGALPDDVLILSESGINTRADVLRVQEAGADAVLVGESLMREADIGAKLRELLGRDES